MLASQWETNVCVKTSLGHFACACAHFCYWIFKVFQNNVSTILIFLPNQGVEYKYSTQKTSPFYSLSLHPYKLGVHKGKV